MYCSTLIGTKIILLSISNTECSFVVTPNGDFNTSRLFLNINITMAVTATTLTAQTLTMNDIIVGAMVALRGTAEHLQLNSSTCQISSLEVYRGREQAIEISRQGFSLSDNGTIQVHKLLSWYCECPIDHFSCRFI